MKSQKVELFENSKRLSFSSRGIIILILALLVACAAKTATQPTDKPVVMEEIKIVEEDTTMPAKPMYEPPPTAPQDDVDVEIKMDAKAFEFLPDELVARKGNKVRLIITSQDMTHRFIMPSYNIDEELPQGEDVVIEFVADKSGDFTFECIPEHAKQGMKGNFHVI